MFRNYFKIALRTLSRNKGFSLINILGLSIGIATCLLILLFVTDELSFDRFHKKADQIVRVAFHGHLRGEKMNEANVMPPTAQALKINFPEVLQATRLKDYGRPRITYGDKLFRNDNFAYVDSNFFQVFTIPLLKGNEKTALIEPNSIVVSAAFAQKYFGEEDPMGKIIQLKDDNTNFRVTGLFGKIPSNSHFQFEVFASMAGFEPARSDSWMTSDFYTYLELPKGYNYKKLEAKLQPVVDRYIGPQLQQATGLDLQAFRKSGNDVGLYLQPLTDIHLHSDFISDLSPAGDIKYVYIFGIIAAFMLLIACINFMNLSTASASKRAREVGIRKVMGSLKGQLVRQFLVEAIVLAVISTVLAIVLVYLALPLFNNLSGKELQFSFVVSPWIIPGLLAFALLTGLLAGSYPAFFLSSFNPIRILKGKLSSGKNNAGLRSGLVVFQFIISILLIVGTTVVYKQLSYIQHKKLGYDKEQVLVIEETYWLGANEQAFRDQLLHDPRISSITSSGYLPAGQSYYNNFMVFPDNKSTEYIKALRYEVDQDYMTTLGIQLDRGRNFSREFGTDSAGIILNQAAVKAFGWTDDPIGHFVNHAENNGDKQRYQVIGVVKDFHFKSLHERISPLVMTLSRNSGNLIVKLKTKDVAGVLASMKKQWDDYKASSNFSYSFLDDRFMKTYQAEQKVGDILLVFAGLTIFVACMGLFGLATFTAEQRTKEIDIRKVLGASITSITRMLSQQFLKLVFIAFLVAAPMAWFIMNRWLQDFAYRIQLDAWIFLLAALLAILITLITVSFRAIRAAIANPIDALRSE